MSDQQTETRKAVKIVAIVMVVTVVLSALLVVGGMVVYRRMRAKAMSSPPSGLGPQFSYNAAALQIVPPHLIAYEETASVKLSFTEAHGIALGPDDRLHVAGDRAIAVFGKDGRRGSDVALDGAPQAVAVAVPDGTLYIAMADHVEVYGGDGKRTAKWEGLGPKALLTAIAVAEKDVFVADAGNREAVRYDTAGKLLGRIGKKDPKRHVPGFIVPSPYFDLAVGPDGMLWVANPGRRRIEAYTFDGDLEYSWGKSAVAVTGFSGCCNPTHIAFFRDGRVVTSEKGAVRVKVSDGTGTLQHVVGAAPDAFGAEATGLDLAIDSSERIYVLDPKAKRVRIFTRKAEQGDVF